MPTHLAIVEDDPVVRESLVTFLSSHPELDIAMAVRSAEDFFHELKGSVVKPDILLLDINLPGLSGLDALPFIREKVPQADIIMLTTFEDNEKIFTALCSGACSYLSKRTPIKKILEAVLTVSQGGSYMSPAIARKVVNHFAPKPKKETPLSPRQQQIVDGIVAGKSYKMIASDLFISIDTVRTHIKKIYRVLQINSKAELIRKRLNREF